MSNSTEPSEPNDPSSDETHSDEDVARIEPLDSMLHLEHPEALIFDLLKHTVVAAHQALGFIHPEIYARGNIGALPDDECHYALLIAAWLTDLPPLLAKYRYAVDYCMREDDGLDTTGDSDDIDIPF